MNTQNEKNLVIIEGKVTDVYAFAERSKGRVMVTDGKHTSYISVAVPGGIAKAFTKGAQVRVKGRLGTAKTKDGAYEICVYADAVTRAGRASEPDDSEPEDRPAKPAKRGNWGRSDAGGASAGGRAGGGAAGGAGQPDGGDGEASAGDLPMNEEDIPF